MVIIPRPVRTGRATALLLGLAFFLAPCMASQDRPLSLDQAVALALERNERAKATAEDVLAAEARVARARAFFLPSLTSTTAFTRRPYERRITVGGSEVVIQRLYGLSETLSLNLSIFDARSLSAYSAVKAQRNAEVAAAHACA